MTAIAPPDLYIAWRTPQYISAIAASYALLGGFLSLMGWFADIRQLTDWWNTGISIKANTAIVIMVMGAALLALLYPSNTTRWISRGLGLFAVLVGALTLTEHIIGVDFGIDTLIFDEPAGQVATAAPGRMGPPAAFSFVLLGIAIFLRASFPARKQNLSVSFAIVVVGIGTLSLVGYGYGAQAMYMIPRLTGISVQTATMLVALAVGLIATYTEHEPMKTLSEDSGIGILARRVMLAAFIVPIGLGWLRIQGFRAGLYDSSFGTALRSIVEIVILVGVLWASVQAIRVRELRQHRAEAERQASEQRLVHKLQEADRRKDEFLATLAHELRNPLTPIRNAAAILMKQNVPTQLLQSNARIIERQVQHMARLLEDLLDISRISRNRLELRKAPVDLKDVIQNAIETSHPTIERAGHELSIELSSERIIVDADAVRLTQVFSNLLNNAAEYTKHSGRISIIVEAESSVATIYIIDNGIGIDDKSMPHIFDLFTQVAPTRSSGEQSGLGIGLALAREIVELHGGTIEAFSAGINTGSKFSVRLPRLQQEHEIIKTETTKNQFATVIKHRLLVVDDLKDNADTLAILLRHFGHEVEVAYGGHAAFIAAEAFKPEVVLMDIGMPELDGLEVCKRIRRETWGRDMVIIAITGWGNADDFHRTQEAGFNSHLVKPVNPEEVMNLLSTMG